MCCKSANEGEVDMSNINVNINHLAVAFLCPKNRHATMVEHACTEMCLFENPIWLLEHYFKNSGVELTDIDRKDIIDFIETRNGRQITEAFLCPINRHATRLEYKCSDDDFLVDENHNRLIKHYLENGGAKAFALRREKIKTGDCLFKNGVLISK